MHSRKLLPYMALLALALMAGCEGDDDAARCGDGRVDTGEQCDDGNTVNDDACANDCTLTGGVCGDGTVDTGEECDDGNTVDGDTCQSDCTLPVGPLCGDGTVDDGEACDDDNNLSGDGCSADCLSTEVCGNAIVDAVTGEQCDDGNAVAGDGCENDCTVTVEACGNGAIDAGEDCDDGNVTDDGNGCDAACARNDVCGDGTVQSLFEECDDGNPVPGDGCENDCTGTVGPALVVCEDLAPLPAGGCEVTPGDSTVLIKGTILVPGTIYRGGQVVYDGAGTIICMGCDCSVSAVGATVITCPQGVVSPGLINTHDHITYTHNLPYTDTGERYEHRHDWRIGLGGHTAIDYLSGASADQVLWGELRFLLGGATTTVGAGAEAGFLRNIDRALQEGLGQAPVQLDTFPLGDASGTQLESGCGYPSITTAASIAGEDAYIPHVSEGVDLAGRNEFLCTSTSTGGGQDLVVPQSAFIHGIGLVPADYAAMATDGTALVWSPRSNITLYGDTAVVTAAARLGVQIALGTDWLSTGSMNLLRELRCADGWNRTYLGGYFTDEQLWMMVTSSAAEVTATWEAIGVLTPGHVADIAIFDGSTSLDHRAVIDAQPEDVLLVLRAGEPLYGDAALVTALGKTTCDALDVCGAAKQVCVMDEIGKSYADLATAAGSSMYAAFFCDPVPPGEPTCVPSRPVAVGGSTVYDGAIVDGDADGDGIADAGDNCPTVFNPVRVVDAGVQADADGDGDGDACDPCPLVPVTIDCAVPDPYDSDGDGIWNASDRCPDVADPLQTDSDGDWKGDACDDCPAYANPGGDACPATIYEVKNGTVAPGSQVAILNALVTGRNTNGFYLQVKAGDADYAGPDYSGVYVYAPANAVAAGDRVTLRSATLTNFYDQLQLGYATIEVVSSLGEAPPDPVIETPASVATGGARAAALEAVIVRVENVSVTSVTPAAGPGDTAPTNEFEVDGGLRVNDYLYLVSPFPIVGQSYLSITGILEWRNGNSKLEPRSPADLVDGPPLLVGLGPALSYVWEGETGVQTVPSPLTVTLSGPALTDTFVTVTSADPAVVVVGGGVTVPLGSSSAPVLVNGVTQSLGVTLTATLDSRSFSADVRVIGPGEAPSLLALDPPAASAAPGGTVTFTVTLDIPAPAGGTTVTLALAPPEAGTIPATVTVPAGQVSATFDYVDSGTGTGGTISATLGLGTLTATVTISSMDHLVINEVDYDQVGTDSAEFIEIYNGTGATVSLAGYSLVLVNGSTNVVYRTIDLSAAGSLAPGQFLLVASPTVVAPPGVVSLDFGLTDQVQNGAPDGIALVSGSELIDALSYEGGITSVTIDVVGSVSLVEGTVLPTATADSNTVAGSLSRLPNGADTNDAAADWAFSATSTPGAENVP